MGERVDEAVAVVESGRAWPFPAVGRRPTRELSLSEIDRHDLNEDRLDQQVERPNTVGPVTRLEDHRPRPAAGRSDEEMARLRRAILSNDERCLRHTGGRQSGGRALLGTLKTAGRDRGSWRLEWPLCDLDDGPARWARGGRVMRRARGRKRPAPGSRRGSRRGSSGMVHGQRGGVYQKQSGGCNTPTFRFPPSLLGFFVINRLPGTAPAERERTGATPLFSPLARLDEWGGTTSCTTPCPTRPPSPSGVAPVRNHPGWKAKTPANGRAQTRRRAAR